MRDRLGPLAEWLDGEGRTVTVYDHHFNTESDIAASHRYVEAVGAVTTLVVEELRSAGIALTPIEATVMALGIHVDTGSLTFEHTTVRDAAALTWLMAQGASPRILSEYVEPGLSPELQDLLPTVLQQMHSKTIEGVTLSWVVMATNTRISGLSGLVSRVMSIAESDIFLLATHYGKTEENWKLSLIGRSRSGGFGTTHLNAVDLGEIFRPLGGGGHPKAAAATVHLSTEAAEPEEKVNAIVASILGQIECQLPSPPIARTIMSSPVRTIQPDLTVGEAHRILLRYGHSGLSVVDRAGKLVGVISRRDLDIALHHNFSHAPVKGFMSTTLKNNYP